MNINIVVGIFCGLYIVTFVSFAVQIISLKDELRELKKDYDHKKDILIRAIASHDVFIKEFKKASIENSKAAKFRGVR